MTAPASGVILSQCARTSDSNEAAGAAGAVERKQLRKIQNRLNQRAASTCRDSDLFYYWPDYGI